MSLADKIAYAKLKVLVVEDEMHTRNLIKTMLRRMEVRLIYDAANGRDGLLQVIDTRPHIVLCDIHMQPINGLEFLQTLRKMEDTGIRDTPVIFLTADANRDNVVIAKENAANGYLVKPISLTALKTRIDQIAAPLKL
jgi:two-component system, chemotaxis family, chemotaxis protein CheY